VLHSHFPQGCFACLFVGSLVGLHHYQPTRSPCSSAWSKLVLALSCTIRCTIHYNSAVMSVRLSPFSRLLCVFDFQRPGCVPPQICRLTVWLQKHKTQQKCQKASCALYRWYCALLYFSHGFKFTIFVQYLKGLVTFRM